MQTLALIFQSQKPVGLSQIAVNKKYRAPWKAEADAASVFGSRLLDAVDSDETQLMVSGEDENDVIALSDVVSVTSGVGRAAGGAAVVCGSAQ